MREITVTILKILITTSIPICFVYYLVWQSISFANLNREVKKLTQKKEELYKKNYELKSRIAHSTSIDKIDQIFRKTNKKNPSYIGTQTITLTLPKENKQFEKK